MAKKGSPWTSGLAINLISNLIAFIVGAVVTYFSHEGSAWVKPVLFGGFAWLLTFCSILAFRLSKQIPRRIEPIDTENVHRRIRDWLDRFNLTVKRVDLDDSFFFFIVTTDGGKRISVSRSNGQFSDYIVVKGLITAGEAEKNALKALNDDELTAARLAIQLELSRAIMGYKAEVDVLQEITIFKRIPITTQLNEEEIFNAMWEVEAMLGSIFTVGAMAIHRNKVRISTQE
jgi:hypothetical protein